MKISNNLWKLSGTQSQASAAEGGRERGGRGRGVLVFYGVKNWLPAAAAVDCDVISHITVQSTLLVISPGEEEILQWY